MTDDGRLLDKYVAHSLVDMRSSNLRETEDLPDDALDGHMEMVFWDFLGRCDVRHLKMLDEAEAKTASAVEREQARGDDVLAEVEAYLLRLRRQRRLPEITDAERERLDARITLIEVKHGEASAWLVRHLASVRAQGDAFETDVMEALQNHGEVEILHTARWVARHAYDRVYREEEPSFLMGGPNPPDRPIFNRTADRHLRLSRLRDDVTERSKREARDAAFVVRTEDWQARDPYRSPKEKQRERRRLAIMGSGVGPEQAVVQSSEWQETPPEPVWLAAEPAMPIDAVEELTPWQKEERALLAELEMWQLGKGLTSPDSSIHYKTDAGAADAGWELPAVEPEAATSTLPFPDAVLVPTTSSSRSSAQSDDSIDDIGALIERDLAELLKDLNRQ